MPTAARPMPDIRTAALKGLARIAPNVEHWLSLLTVKPNGQSYTPALTYGGAGRVAVIVRSARNKKI